MKIDIITLENGQSMLVEVLDIEIPNDIKNRLNSNKSNITDLPEGGEFVGALDDIQDNMKMGMQLLKDDLKNIAGSIQDAFVDNQPDEFSVELNFGFAGKGSVVPFLLSGEAKGGIKVKATWKKGDK